MKTALNFTFLACLISSAVFAQDGDAPKSERDRYKKDLAGNKKVEEIIRNFAGKGTVGDETEPTPAHEAIEMFEIADGLAIDLVADESGRGPQPAEADPDLEVMQPLYMHFDEFGRMWVVEYKQYPFPEGLKVIKYDQYLRAVFDKVPQPPPNHVKGRDQLRVFSDTNGDGTYDTSRVAIDGLNIVSSVVTGQGGIWVLNPPYLMFYPDANGDAIPDGDPVVKLSGFGIEDTHSVSNSLRWGPDGWLYAANGSTSTGNVSSTHSKNVKWVGQNIWRYHPVLDRFEIFAEGGGNTFSTEIDNRGRVFSGTNHGSTRGMFYPQGSYGTKNWGKHGPLTNPYAFGYFNHMKHEGDRDRFAQTFVIYEGGTLPEQYHGNVIAANALHNRVWASTLTRDGSTYRTKDMPTVATTNDHWFRPVDVKVGPDGAVYVADWYDSRLTHVDPRDNWHKKSGRIYRIQRSNGPQHTLKLNLRNESNADLISRFKHPNKWHRQTAVRILGERLRLAQNDDTTRQQNAATIAQLRKLAQQDVPHALEAIWALHWADAFDETAATRALQHRDEHIRRWAVRLLGDHRAISPAIAQQLAEMAQSEPDVQVRSQLAASVKRISTEAALPILQPLLEGADAARNGTGPEGEPGTSDASDPHMPLMLWWAMEAHAGTQPIGLPHVSIDIETPKTSPRDQLLVWLEQDSLWEIPLVQNVILARLMRRFAMDPEPGSLDACARLLQLASTDAVRQKLMNGFLEAYEGREIDNLPSALQTAIEEYQKSLGKSDLLLGLKLGKEDGIKRALGAIGSSSTPLPVRLALIRQLGEVPVKGAVSPLLSRLGDSSSAVKLAALEAMMSYPDDSIGRTICSRYHSSIPNEHGLRETAHRVLASRPTWAKMFMAEVDAFRIKPESIALDVVQQMRLHKDADLDKLLTSHFGTTRATPAAKLKEMERIKTLARSETPVDLKLGKALFTKHCAVCHTFFNEGGKTGPNLTGYERTNTNFLALAIADPSAGIREEFTQFQIATIDGRILTGLIDQQTPTTVSLRGANNQVTLIPRDQIEILQAMTTSLMPDDLTSKLTDEEVHAILKYVMNPTPIE